MNQPIYLHTPQHQSHLNDMHVVISLQPVFLCCVHVRVRMMAEEIQNRFNQIVCLEIEWTTSITLNLCTDYEEARSAILQLR